jgi:intein/homing endonuclease/predicted lipid-binding transport protein (Tim44 family)
MKRLLGLAGFILLLIFPSPGWPRGGGGCLEQGTLISTVTGSVAIEKLKVGDRVWAVDGGALKEARVQAVIEVFPEKFLEIRAGGGHLRITAEHPIMTGPGEYTMADHLTPGTSILLARSGKLLPAPIQSIRNVTAQRPAYNLLVSPSGTFVAGQVALHNKGCFLPDSPILMADGTEKAIRNVQTGDTLWAFNTDGHLVATKVRSIIHLEVDQYIRMKTDRVTLEVTAEHPFYVGKGKFKTVDALKAGDTVLAFDGKWLTEQRILSLEKIPQKVQVFNLQTDQPNTFFASGLAVHNKGGGCFPPGTAITTPSGRKNIETLAAGDEILAVDQKGRTVATRVKTIFVTRSPLLKIETPAGNLLTTTEHPLALGEGRFRAAGELKANDPVLQWEKGRIKIERIQAITAGAGEALVFNLEVEAPHTFIAEGLVVHNKGGGCLPAGTPIRTPGGQTAIEQLTAGCRVLSVDAGGSLQPVKIAKIFSTRALVVEVETKAGSLKTTTDHPFGCPGGRYKEAGDLRPGDRVLIWENGRLQATTVLRTTREEREQPVFNLTVEPTHTFLAAGFLTHNKGGSSSSSSRSSSGSSSGGNADLTGIIFAILFMILWVFLFVIIIRANRKKKKEENLDFVYSPNQIAPKAGKTEKLLTFLSRQDPAMKPEELRNQAGATFLKLQECWSKRAYDPMKPLLMPDLYNQHLSQLQGLVRNHEFNRIDDLKMEKIDLVNVRYTEKAGQREFTVLITASARDYYRDDRDGKFLRGDQSSARFQEFWTFQQQDGQWLLRDIEQAGESDRLKEDNFAEMLTDDTLKGIYGAAAASGGQAGPWLEKEVEQKASRIDRMLNFLAQTDKLWNRNLMLERARKIFLEVYLAREKGHPEQIPTADLFPQVSESLREQIQSWIEQGYSAEYRNLCVRKAELVLVRNFADNTRDEFLVLISAHAQRIIRKGEAVMNQQAYVTPFEEYWTFGRLDGQWKLKEILPPGRGEKEIAKENMDEDSSPDQLQWYYRQTRAQ